ncbi:hypothetical protein TL16_g09799 [Triparma laevis f. inornata]|uniref:EF-hand domain-containing protein n=1 Tax=Triparma laevis f. inornata TaxID=1714386 RepID=A0A9W7ENB6_9STRA|nr:hypothetical protein TL16_g09799 [Triparma laevis f. inornata]
MSLGRLSAVSSKMPEEGGSIESIRKEEDKPNEEGGEEEEKSPFPTDKYILPEEWDNPIIKLWLTHISINSRIIALSDLFSNFILVVIIIAGALVGIQTYPGMETDSALIAIDNIILITFCVEILVKMFAEGLAPWRYFLGPEWRWNNFDFLVVMLCMPFVDLGNSIALLRLFRLMRLAKLVRKIPQLQMIIMGLVGGFSSIGYILLLLFLVFYLFAIAGIYAFRENDPWHYGDLWTALLTLFRASTLEDWTDLMYINMFGCDTYANVYVGNADRVVDNSEYWCTFPMEKYWLTQIYFVFFIVVSALVMLSLFVGAVTMSMTESMEAMKEEDEAKQKAKMKAKQLKKIETSRAATMGKMIVDENSTNNSMSPQAKLAPQQSERPIPSRRLTVAIGEMVGLGNPADDALVESTKMQRLMLGAWEGVDLTGMLDEEVRKVFGNPVRQKYHDLSLKAKTIVEDTRFVNFITLVIVIAGALVGAQTYEGWGEMETYEGSGVFVCETDRCKTCGLIDFIILLIFTVEITLKFLAADHAPLRVLLDPWNAFDFLIVLGSWFLGGGMITMLRLLRLLRVLKLVKAFPQLQVIVQALMMGMASIGYIGVILFMVFYVFAILGMIMFAANDPWHFGTLHISMLSLFRASTFEDWTDIMYINMYGCDQYGYSAWPEYCTDPHASGAMAGIFFVIFVIIGGLVLLTLFIGVVSTSMDEAQQGQREEAEMEEKVKDLQKEKNIDKEEIEIYRKIFSMLDLDGGGTIEEEELRVGLESIGKQPTDDELTEMLKQVDEDNSGEIDLAEFIQFMYNMKIGKSAASDKVYEIGKKEFDKRVQKRMNGEIDDEKEEEETGKRGLPGQGVKIHPK